MFEQLKFTVGNGGINLSQDVATVQDLLNRVPRDYGGPQTMLAVNGILDDSTVEAIQRFQQRHLGKADGVITPNQATFMKLSQAAISRRILNDGKNYL
ncbi:MAG: peptidoglycan-binding protein [Gammaproteobacteria bacterium]|nr:peptidoglycan-binding protein [Gammaproteobacteria bacterium]